MTTHQYHKLIKAEISTSQGRQTRYHGIVINVRTERTMIPWNRIYQQIENYFQELYAGMRFDGEIDRSVDTETVRKMNFDSIHTFYFGCWRGQHECYCEFQDVQSTTDHAALYYRDDDYFQNLQTDNFETEGRRKD